jgi:hypothetical protein
VAPSLRNAPGADLAFVSAGIAMGERTLDDERDRLEAAMGMRAERQPVIVRRIDLRPVMVQKQEWIDLFDLVVRQGSLRAQIPDII